jgi:hypothetical protein
MAKLTLAGEQTLAEKNIVTYTKVYLNDSETPVENIIGYQINRSRKFGAAKLSLNVANPEGKYSFRKQADPLFSYGNKIRLVEGLEVNGKIEEFTRFTGVIVSQTPSNTGGKASLTVSALDNMKLLIDYVPNEFSASPTIYKIYGEELDPVDSNRMQFKCRYPEHLPWVDIPYPIFYSRVVDETGPAKKIKEGYELDLINGEVYFGEKMWVTKEYNATLIQGTDGKEFSITMPIQDPRVRRSYKVEDVYPTSDGDGGTYWVTKVKEATDTIIPTFTVSAKKVIFASDPFVDLPNSYSDDGSRREYTEKKILITTRVNKIVTADYQYYDTTTNKAEQVIKKLALEAGFPPDKIYVGETGVCLTPVRFNYLNIKNGFEGIQKIKQQLPPNYIIACDSEGNLRGYLADQQPTADYELNLIKRIQAPVSEESLYSCVVAHGLDPNPADLADLAQLNQAEPVKILWADKLFGGTIYSILNKDLEDQISWRVQQINDSTPPDFPKDLLQINLRNPRKIEQIDILMGNYQKGSIQQSVSVQVSEDGLNWFYPDRSARGLSGSSSQWVTVKGGELDKRKIKHIKIVAEAGFSWVDTKVETDLDWFDIDTTTTNYYYWYLAIKEIQIWEENTLSTASSIGNCFGFGDGVKTKGFYIPNVPLELGSVIIYHDGVRLESGYTVDHNSGEVVFDVAPTGVLTADYMMKVKVPSVSEVDYNSIYSNNAVIIDPPGTLSFSGGNISADSPEHKLLKKIRLKKKVLKIDSFLNSHKALKKRGEEILKEISRLQETLDVDIVYRPDVDICQTVDVTDELLGITQRFFIEEITETKQGYKPSFNIKMSNYSL